MLQSPATRSPLVSSSFALEFRGSRLKTALYLCKMLAKHAVTGIAIAWVLLRKA